MSLFNHWCRELLNSQEWVAGTKKHSKTGRQLVSASNYDFSHRGRYNTDNRPVIITVWKPLSVCVFLCVCIWVGVHACGCSYLLFEYDFWPDH